MKYEESRKCNDEDEEIKTDYYSKYSYSEEKKNNYSTYQFPNTSGKPSQQIFTNVQKRVNEFDNQETFN